MNDFSLIVTANRKNFLIECLMSIMLQTDKNFELILCLDVKNTPDLKEYCNLYFNRIDCTNKKIITLIGNGTAGYTRNYAFKNTSGKWIAYLDGDDMLLPNSIEAMKKYIKCKTNIDIFSSGIIRINKKGICYPIEESLHYYPPINIYEVDPDSIHQPTYFNQFQAMKREVWENYNFDTSSNGEDIDFMLINLLKWHFYKIPKYLYMYRDVEESFSKIEYKDGDFTTKRYESGFYKKYFKKNYKKEFKFNFKGEYYENNK